MTDGSMAWPQRQDDDEVKLTVVMPASVRDRLERIAERERRSRSGQALVFIEAGLDDSERLGAA